MAQTSQVRCDFCGTINEFFFFYECKQYVCISCRAIHGRGPIFNTHASTYITRTDNKCNYKQILQDKEEEIRSLKEKIEKIQAENNSYRKDNKIKEDKINSLEADIEKMKTENDNNRKEKEDKINSLEADIEKMKTENNNNRKDTKEKEDKINSLEADIEKMKTENDNNRKDAKEKEDKINLLEADKEKMKKKMITTGHVMVVMMNLSMRKIKDIKEKEDKINSLEADIEKMKTENDNNSKKLLERDQEIRSIGSAIKGMVTESFSLSNGIEIIKCLKDLTTNQNSPNSEKLKEKEEQIRLLKEQVKKLEADYSDMLYEKNEEFRSLKANTENTKEEYAMFSKLLKEESEKKIRSLETMIKKMEAEKYTFRFVEDQTFEEQRAEIIRLNKKLDEYESVHSKYVNETQSRILQNEIRTLQDKIMTIETENNTCRQTLQAKEDEIRSLGDKIRNKEEEIRLIKEKLEKSETDNTTFRQNVQAKEDEIRSLKGKIKNKEEEIRLIKDKLEKSKTDNSTFSKQISEKDTEIKSLEGKTKDQDEKIRSLQDDIKNKEAKNNSSSGILGIIERFFVKNPESPNEENSKQISEKDKELKSLEDKTKNQDEKIRSLQDDIKYKEAKNNSLSKQISEKDKELKSLEDKTKDQDEKIRSLQDDIKNKEAKNNSLRMVNTVKENISAVERRKDILIVAAIHLDNSACVCYSSYLETSDAISVQIWKDVGILRITTPTCILIKKEDRQFVSFGYKAKENYAKIVKEGRVEEYYFFDNFIKVLHTHKDISKDMLLEDVRGEKFPAIDIFAAAIRSLSQALISGWEIDISKEVLWVLAVPALGTKKVKEFIKESAERTMDEEKRRLVLGSLPSLTSLPPDETNFLRFLIEVLLSIARPPPDQLLDLRYRIVNHEFHSWEGRDVFQMFSQSRYSFFEITGETPETLLEIVRVLGNEMRQTTGRPHRLSPRNRVMMFMLWMRSYPSYHFLSMLFDVSVTTVHDEINWMLPKIWEQFHGLVRWPTLQEWNLKIGNWEKLPFAVGAIDGTSTEIYRPQIEPQELYFSGHRHYHVIHTQVVIDNSGNICHIQSGFLGHQNDAQQFRLMPQIGPNQDLVFPPDTVLLADKIYANGYPLMTPYTRRQLAARPEHRRAKCRKFNRLITEYRVKVEHSICDLKRYRVMGTLWRHPRPKLRKIVEICGALVCRRKSLFYS